MLRVSGIAPHDNDAGRLFVTHSLLIAIARLVAHGLTRDRGGLARRPRRRLRVLDLGPGPGMGRRAAPDHREARLEAPPARRHAVLVHRVRVGPGDRKVFGEYYTPDWLAALIVREALDETWRSRAIEQAETSARTSTRLDGVGVLDPTCGSRNLPLPRRPADPRCSRDARAQPRTSGRHHSQRVRPPSRSGLTPAIARTSNGPAMNWPRPSTPRETRSGRGTPSTSPDPIYFPEQKVDRIVANPPWVKLSEIQAAFRELHHDTLVQSVDLEDSSRSAGERRPPNVPAPRSPADGRKRPPGNSRRRGRSTSPRSGPRPRRQRRRPSGTAPG